MHMTSTQIILAQYPPGYDGLPVQIAGSRAIIDVRTVVVGALYLRTAYGARTDGVVTLKHAPDANWPASDWQAFSPSLMYSAAGVERLIDLTDVAYLGLFTTTQETGGTWILDARVAGKGDVTLLPIINT